MPEPLYLLWIVCIAFAQNVSFSMVSRSRNRSSRLYHIVAAILSNGVWFLTFHELVKSEMDWTLFVPYTIGTVSGSQFGVEISKKIENLLGATADGEIR